MERQLFRQHCLCGFYFNLSEERVAQALLHVETQKRVKCQHLPHQIQSVFGDVGETHTVVYGRLLSELLNVGLRLDV